MTMIFRNDIKRIVIITVAALATLVCHASDVELKGCISDAVSKEPLEFATVQLLPGNHAAQTDEEGNFKLSVPAGEYRLKVSYAGYRPHEQKLAVVSDKKLDIRLKPLDNTLGEVVITAKESTGITSGSRIDRDAMEHLQPTSFTDLLELLPGNISKDPDMGSANSISLRETGALTATGQSTSTGDDYAISSLGTSFVVDGAPVSTDADMTGVPGAVSGSAEAKRATVNKGVDMRTISTDNIESVEIVRGIPSSEYGNLTSGVVNIRRIRKSTPFTARLKVDEYSKLFSLGKGFSLKRWDHIINVDAGYLDSKIDPRDNLENYKRLNGSIRANMHFSSESLVTNWVYGFDYTGSFDNVKTDPDLSMLKIDEYKSSYSRYAFTSELSMEFQRNYFISNLNFTGSVSYAEDILTRRKQVAPQRASVAPTTLEPGVHDGQYLLSEYVADFKSEGKPFAAFLKFKAAGSRQLFGSSHKYKAGVEWTLAKNYGRGQIYDLTRPLSASWTTRPRSFRSIPALHTLSFFIEDFITLPIGNTQLDLQLGLRSIQIPSLDKKFYLSNRPYLDPRVNAVWKMPRFNAGGKPMEFLIAGGFGLTTKMPTVDYLYPQVHYNDIIQLNYYDIKNPTANSRVNLRTYIEDPTNYGLRAARNRKWELRIGGEWWGNRLSVTYFDERMNSGFRYSAVYAPYEYRKYDASGIVPGSLSAPPALENLPYEDLRVLDGMRRVTNGSRIDKQGVEFQISTRRWKPVATSLIITGAWFRTRYSNSQMLYSTVSDVVGNQAVNDLYVGIYNTNDGRINEQFNTNFMFDTQITRWGLVFSTTVQCLWYVKTRRLTENGTPVAYISAADGKIHDYGKDAEEDSMLRYLMKTYNPELFRTQTIPPAVYLNFKATKKIGKWLRLSAFVNRIIDYLPDYTSNGLRIRRTSSAYFGMEANITI